MGRMRVAHSFFKEVQTLKVWHKACLLVLLLAAPGCLPSQSELRMERDLEEMKRRLADTERAQRQDRSADLRERLDQLTRSQADQQATLDALRVEMQSFSGRIEDQGRQRQTLRDELSLVRDDLGLKVSALEDRLTKLEQRPVPAPVAAQPMAAEALYERGLAMIQKGGQFAQGRELLQEFLAQHPKSPLAVNAMYWIGEAYYGEKKFESAILQFQDVVQQYSEHPKVAAALLKQGMAFHALGDVKNGRVILQKLIETFPLADEAKKAKERLAEWQKR
jgi:tol-pal system protein YbgF